MATTVALGAHPAPAIKTIPGASTSCTGEARRLSICLINPRFSPSYWGFDYALPVYPGDRRCTMITGALPALAGLVPDGHRVDILDENVETVDLASLDHYDIVGVTGMIVQRERMREILLALKDRPPLVVVGGAVSYTHLTLPTIYSV